MDLGSLELDLLWLGRLDLGRRRNLQLYGRRGRRWQDQIRLLVLMLLDDLPCRHSDIQEDRQDRQVDNLARHKRCRTFLRLGKESEVGSYIRGHYSILTLILGMSRLGNSELDTAGSNSCATCPHISLISAVKPLGEWECMDPSRGVVKIQVHLNHADVFCLAD